jgi:hypothetical protein
VDSLIDTAHRARVRTAQIDGRIRELRERNEWLTKDGLDSGSTPEQAMRAARFAGLARARASEAARRTVTAHLNAAAAHDRAAKLFDDLASAAVGDAAALGQKASKHRAWAEDERETARVMAAQDETQIAVTGAAASALPPRAGRRRERGEPTAADGHVADD